jgi:hypothetical protein
MVTNLKRLSELVDETLSDEDKRLIVEGQQLATEWAQDKIYPAPNDDAEFFTKYVNPVVVPNHEERLARIVGTISDWANHQREVQHTNQP